MTRRTSWGAARRGRRTPPPLDTYVVDRRLDAMFRAAVVPSPASAEPAAPDPPGRAWPAERQVLLAERAELRRVLTEQRRAAVELQAVIDERDRLVRARRDDLVRASVAVADLTARIHRLAEAGT